jgi:hypothetical protein
MGMGSSSICVLAVVTSSVSLTLTHEEADYYMVCGRIVAPPAERIPTSTAQLAPLVALRHPIPVSPPTRDCQI